MYDSIDFANIPEDQIESKECRFAIHIKPPTYDHPDAHYIKEVIHLKDGTTIPNVRMEFDRERDFYVTRKGFRDHQQHKEWEFLDRLQKFSSTERQMGQKVANALHKPWLRNLQACLKEPYVYGIDITSTAVIKRSYMDRWKKVTPFTIAELDIESDVVDGTDRPTILSLSMPPTYGQPARCYTYVTKHYVRNHPNFIQEVKEETEKLLIPLLKEYRDTSEVKIKFQAPYYDFDFHIEVVEDDMVMWFKAFELAHQWQPDFLSIWNMTYEMGKLEQSCERYGVDPRDFMCDPRIPREYRNYEYIEGKAQKITASDRKMPIKPAARWHWVNCPMPFIIIDQMCVYKQTRMGEQEEPSYSLDAIMNKELKLSKLHVPEADHIPHATLEWHEYMQKHYRVKYCVYNRFDVIGPQLIEEKVKDMSLVMPSMAGTSDFTRFPSQPRRTCDAMHWYVLGLEQPRVMGVTSNAMVDDYDDETIERDGWVNQSSMKLTVSFIKSMPRCWVTNNRKTLNC